MTAKKNPEKLSVVVAYKLSEISTAIRTEWGLASASPIAFLVAARRARVRVLGRLSLKHSRSL